MSKTRPFYRTPHHIHIQIEANLPPYARSNPSVGALVALVALVAHATHATHLLYY